MELSELQALAGALSPMGQGAVPILQGRTLYLDADGLAYFCAGNDDTTIGQARQRTKEKIAEMQAACGAEKVVLLLTGSGSHKGHRYAIARVNPYQAQRVGSRRPKNWQHLRDALESGSLGDFIIDYDREADDRFGQFGHADPANTVSGSDDKDMQMVPGWHINWRDNRVCYLEPGKFDMVMWDKQFGIKWFWLQMLHGDDADKIPGLPRIGITTAGRTPDGPIIVPMPATKLAKIGAVGAGKLLAPCLTSEEAAHVVAAAYKSFYGDRWLVEMLEQACLLWMRRGDGAHWDDVLRPGGPMAVFNGGGYRLPGAYAEIEQRVKEADAINAIKSE